MRRGVPRAGILELLPLVLVAWPVSAVGEEGTGEATPGEGVEAEVDGEATLPAAAAARRFLVEPVGGLPAPWAALSAVLDGGTLVDWSEGWTSLRVHVPVASRYGAVDAHLTVTYDGEGFVGVEPELWLRAIPLRLVDGGRGALGVAFGVAPGMTGPNPRMDLTGGLMGGYLGSWWFARALLGVRGEVLQLEDPPTILGQVAGGLRLAHGLRPQIEVDVSGPADEEGEPALVLRPALRYWPAAWIGIGASGDIGVLGPQAPWGALRLDIVLQAME